MNTIKKLTFCAALWLSVPAGAEISGSGHQVQGCYGLITTFVWNDFNGNGVQDAGEPGINSIELGLSWRNQPQAGEDVLATDTDGNARFINLCLRSHLLRVDEDTVPAGMTVTAINVDTDERDVFDNDGDDEFEPVRIDLHHNHVVEESVDFGFHRESCEATLGDYVWIDDNGDGLQDEFEAGLAGVALSLYDAGGELVATSVSDSDGRYLIGNLCDGLYTLVVDATTSELGDLPATAQSQGGDADSDSDLPESGAPLNLVVNGESDLALDFGFLHAGCAGRLTGSLFIDENEDGNRDPAEAALEGVTVTAIGSDEFEHTAVTDGDGAFVFGRLCADSYSLTPDTDSLPPGITLAGDPVASVTVNLPASDVQVDLSAIGLAAACAGQIGDYVWLDGNQNGRQDGIEPGIDGVRLTLRDAVGEAVASSTTDANGVFRFNGLCAGDYAVQVDAGTLDEALSPTTRNSGDATGDSDGAAPVWVTLPSAAASVTDVDFGYLSAHCTLVLDSTCSVLSAEAASYSCDKPVDLLTLVWDGLEPIRVVAHKGETDDEILADIDNVEPGAAVTVRGFAGGPKDVVWEIYRAGTSDKLGESNFKLSCDDHGMDGPEDCGLRQGDGKNGDRCQAGCLNDWLLEEIVDNKGRLLCTQLDDIKTGSCTLDDPAQVTYRYRLTNIGLQNVGQVSAQHSQFGELADATGLPAGQSRTLVVNDYVENSRSSSISVAAEDATSACQVTARVDISLLAPPACRAAGEGNLSIDHDKFKWKITNTGNQVLTVSGIDLSWPVENANLKEIKLSGAKIVDFQVSPPTASLSAGDFQGNLDKRQIDPGKTEDLEIKFTQHYHESPPPEYAITIHFAEGCSLTYVNTGKPYACTQPIGELRMIWDGQMEPVTVRGYRGNDGDELMFEQNGVMRGATVTHAGLDGSEKDIIWEVFYGGNEIGESKFHVSCSDNEMKAAQHCGRRQGDGKDNKAHLINDWLLDGLVDEDGPVDCPER